MFLSILKKVSKNIENAEGAERVGLLFCVIAVFIIGGIMWLITKIAIFVINQIRMKQGKEAIGVGAGEDKNEVLGYDKYRNPIYGEEVDPYAFEMVRKHRNSNEFFKGLWAFYCETGGLTERQIECAKQGPRA